MKFKLLAICTATMVILACNNEKKTEATASETASDSVSAAKSDEPWVPVDSATMMKNMMEYGTPGPMHQMLASWNGTWKGEATIWEHEGATPQKSAGKAVNTMIMGGKYQTSKHTGDMMGMPFEGMSIMAYDNAARKFNSTWIDTWSTGIMNMTGSWDEPSKSLTLTGTMPDINRPGKQCSFREVLKVVDDNNHVMEMYGPDPKTGKEYKMMEMKMTRQK